MLRSNAANLYGWDILLRGTFWPGPSIGTRLADIVRLPQEAGHETGLHAWDHHNWQINIDRYSQPAMLRQLRAGFDRLADILGKAPTCSAAAGWRCNEQALLLKEQFNFSYNSDCRGDRMFRPQVGSQLLAPQIPVTLPTYDEIIGSAGIDNSNYNAHILDRVLDPIHATNGSADRLHVYTIHAEVEGIALHRQFEQLLIEARQRGIVFQPLRQLLQHNTSVLPADRMAGVRGWIHDMTAYLALAVSIVLTVVSQALQKKAADDCRRAAADSTLQFYLHSTAFWLALVTLGGSMLSWLVVLSALEVSRAYSLLSINYVAMLLVSRFIFHEDIPAHRWFGVATLLGGILLIVGS
jgi:undecaprenyl phosphate-alpha-L-ara4FN deformylase